MKRHLIVLTVFAFVFAVVPSNAQNADSLKIKELEKRIEKLEQKQKESELQKLINEAETASKEKQPEKKTKVFKSGQRSLQAINPEMSFTGEGYGQYSSNESQTGSGGFYFRKLGLHIAGGLDPFSFMKAAVEFSPEGVELGEAYITWTKFIPSISLTAGKFRQQFGVVNRWHVHAADQFDYPLALTTILGEDGLNQIGLSFDWLMPAITADANELTLQITNGQNEQLFAGSTFSFPSVLAHLKNYYDINRNTYLELGLTGVIGNNLVKPLTAGTEDFHGKTVLGGADLTLSWEPVNQSLYHSFVWRSELYYADKEISSTEKIKALGGYSYFEYRFNEWWQAGFRFDYTQPFKANNSDLEMHQFVPYVTWWQSHWVRLRLQYNYLDGNVIDNPAGTLRLQMVFAVGPHKHDRY